MSTDYMTQALAASMHVALCYKGGDLPVCAADVEDAALTVRDLRERGWNLTRIEEEANE